MKVGANEGGFAAWLENGITKMIGSAVVDEIKRLLSVGKLSQRKIALRMGVSRGTVGAIALGKRPDHEAGRRMRESSFIAPAGRPVRCPGCGGMAQMPCLACHVRALAHRERMTARRHLGLQGNRV